MKTRDTKLVICTRCGGHGQLRFATGDERIHDYKICDTCDGTGIERTVTIEYEKLKKTSILNMNELKQVQNAKPGMDPWIYPVHGRDRFPRIRVSRVENARTIKKTILFTISGKSWKKRTWIYLLNFAANLSWHTRNTSSARITLKSWKMLLKREHWKPAEKQFVMDNIGKLSPHEMARHLRKTEKAVEQYIHRNRIIVNEKVNRNVVKRDSHDQVQDPIF